MQDTLDSMDGEDPDAEDDSDYQEEEEEHSSSAEPAVSLLWAQRSHFFVEFVQDGA